MTVSIWIQKPCFFPHFMDDTRPGDSVSSVNFCARALEVLVIRAMLSMAKGDLRETAAAGDSYRRRLNPFWNAQVAMLFADVTFRYSL